jgi:hypothetical protein
MIIEQPSNGDEGAVMATQPKLRLRDASNDFVNNVGYGETGTWVVMATIRQGTGHPNANITGNSTVKFSQGWANFTELSISHSGSGYVLDFHISQPQSASFNASSVPFDIAERKVNFVLSRQPGDGNEGEVLPQQPQIEVRDSSNNEIVNTGWKGGRWYAKASLMDANSNGAMLGGDTTVEFVEGVATFTDLTVDISGLNYQLNIETNTDPVSSYADRLTTAKFDIAYNSGNSNTAPVFSESFPTVTLREDTTVDTLVTKANATDSNPGLNGVLRFSISSGDSQGFFKVDSVTGEIKVAKTLDLESTQLASYPLTVKVEDKGNPRQSATQILNIEISSVNEFAPKLSSNINETVREDSAVFTVVGKVLASDDDFGEDGRLSYSIVSGNDEGCFKINTTTGMKIQLQYIASSKYI